MQADTMQIESAFTFNMNFYFGTAATGPACALLNTVSQPSATEAMDANALKCIHVFARPRVLLWPTDQRPSCDTYFLPQATLWT